MIEMIALKIEGNRLENMVKKPNSKHREWGDNNDQKGFGKDRYQRCKRKQTNEEKGENIGLNREFEMNVAVSLNDQSMGFEIGPTLMKPLPFCLFSYGVVLPCGVKVICQHALSYCSFCSNVMSQTGTPSLSPKALAWLRRA